MSTPTKLGKALIVSSKASLGQYIVMEDYDFGNIRGFLDGAHFLDPLILEAYKTVHPDVEITNIANNIGSMNCTANTFEYKCAVVVKATDDKGGEGVLTDMLDIYVFRDSLVESIKED